MNTTDDADSPGRETPNNSGWVTFEARVRGRRFARCLERADEAINLGQMDDAREALTEAKALWPDAPEIAEFESRIVSGPSPGAVLLASDVPRVESDSGWRGLIAASAVLLALSSLAGFGFLRLQSRSRAADADRRGRPCHSRRRQRSARAPRLTASASTAAGTRVRKPERPDPESRETDPRKRLRQKRPLLRPQQYSERRRPAVTQRRLGLPPPRQRPRRSVRTIDGDGNNWQKRVATVRHRTATAGSSRRSSAGDARYGAPASRGG